MNNDQLNSLLDSIYELEGLVHLAISREDIPASLPILIARKGEELAARAKAISMDYKPHYLTPANANESFWLNKTMQDDEPAKDDEPVQDDEPAKDDESVQDIESVQDDESVQDIESVQDDIPIRTEEPSPASEPTAATRGRLVFSVNDRYRFKRELFANSDADFNNTLALVASMETYDEAEDYFLDELQWNTSRDEVAEFLAILKKYFK